MNRRVVGAHRARGFTLIELIVTVAIVALLASVAMPVVQLASQRSKEQDLKRALWQIRGALDAYKRAYDDGRILRVQGRSGYPPSLEILVEGVVDARSPQRAKMRFLRSLPRDPLHPDGTQPAAATWGKRSYASPAEAPAEGDDVYDVYSLSEKSGLNGVPYRQW